MEITLTTCNVDFNDDVNKCSNYVNKNGENTSAIIYLMAYNIL